MSTSLEIVGPDKTLAMPGVSFTPTALAFESPPTEDILREVGHLLQRMGSSLRYWQGDHLNALLKLVVTPKPKDTQEKVRQLELGKIAEYADVTGQNRDALAEADAVARFFPASARHPRLKFEHHVEAWSGCDGDFLLANAWLDMAEAHEWNVAKLRAHIRAGRSSSGENTEPRPDDVDDSAEIELWAARQLTAAKALTPAAAANRLKALHRTVALVDTLRAIATAPGKESIPAAARQR